MKIFAPFAASPILFLLFKFRFPISGASGQKAALYYPFAMDDIVAPILQHLPSAEKLADSADADTLVVALLVSSSSALYTLIWMRPRAFAGACSRALGGGDPCRAMARVCMLLKVAQLAGVAHLARWDWRAQLEAAARLPPALAVAAAALVLCGQALNLSVYATLGSDGVYYGARFGKTIAWVYGWPYSLGGFKIRDPQYVGCMLTLMGAFAIVEAPRSRVAMIAWMLNYFYLVWLESAVPSDEAGAALVVEGESGRPSQRRGAAGGGAKRRK